MTHTRPKSINISLNRLNKNRVKNIQKFTSIKSRSSSAELKRGTVILEAAIAVPIILLTFIILLVGINCVQADLAFAQAVDQSTNEAAIVVPVVDAGLDVISDILSGIDNREGQEDSASQNDSLSGVAQGLGFVHALTDYIGIEGEDVLGTLVFGKAIRDRIVWTYDQLCQNKLIRNSIKNVSVYVDYNRMQKTIYLDVYYEWVTPFSTFEKKIRSSIPVYAELQLNLDLQSDQKTADSVWEMSNFERGLYFRKLYGANLPESFPVISAWENGTATSIKSIDLTAPGYQSGNDLEKKVFSHINDLARYSGTDQPWGKDHIFIDGQDINNRVLILIIPENAPDSIINELYEYENYANNHGVDLICKQHGVSARYQQDESESENSSNT